MTTADRPIWLWTACAISFLVLIWGAWALLTLAEFGLVSPVEAAGILLVPFISLVTVLFRRWWGLALTALFAVWLLGFSKFASIYAASALAVFYAPLASVAFLQHRRFKW